MSDAVREFEATTVTEPGAWVLVPRHLSPEMIEAFDEAISVWLQEIGESDDVYAAVLKAAPPTGVANPWELLDRITHDGEMIKRICQQRDEARQESARLLRELLDCRIQIATLSPDSEAQNG
jgi:hypothetical protein